jgi:hypothetical protein
MEPNSTEGNKKEEEVEEEEENDDVVDSSGVSNWLAISPSHVILKASSSSYRYLL